jgi:hypothetical protein
MQQASADTKRRQCNSCSGTGELGTDAGVVDCPDCGGSGLLPHPHTLVEWRMRDIERHYGSRHYGSRHDNSRHEGASHEAVAADVRWLVSEVRRAREALTEIVALAQDGDPADVGARVQMTAVRALEFYEISASPEPKA